MHWVGAFKGRLGSSPTRNKGKFEFNKKDNHEKVVKGAEFGIYQGSEEKVNSTSDGNGLVSFTGIEAGIYTLREKVAPNGYDISKAEVEVTVSDEGTVNFKENGAVKTRADIEVLFTNKVSTVNFNFTKVEVGTNTVIPDVIFNLKSSDNKIISEKSSVDGTVAFKNIELGTYTLEEIKPSNYKQAGPWIVNVTKYGASIEGKPLEKIENIKVVEKTGSFKFNKKDNHGNLLKDARFTLYQGSKVYNTTSTDNGLVAFNNIKEGTYILKETSAPKGYEISKAEVEVMVNSEGTVTFKENGLVKMEKDLDTIYINKVILGSISFTKYINDKNGVLAGAEFELLSNGKRYGGAVFSDANGLVKFLDVKPGEYKIREISSHSNYFKTSDKVVDVVIDDNGVSSLVGQDKIEAETLFINKINNTIQFIKYDDKKSVLSNATFELLKGTNVIATSISDKNGVIRFDNILPGEYIIREKSAPKGYIKSEATRKLVVKDNGEILITASDIKDWEEAFKNKVNKSGVDYITDNNNNTEKENKDNVGVPYTSDKTNEVVPLVTAILSLSVLLFLKKVKY